MSLDYPNREDWLAFRTKAVRAVKYLHISVDVGHYFKGPLLDQIAYWRTPPGKGKTYRKPVEA